MYALFFLILSFLGGNKEPGAVGTTRWWPTGIALQKRRFSKTSLFFFARSGRKIPEKTEKNKKEKLR